jgi:Phosphatidylglycerophosphatase A and related proteins
MIGILERTKYMVEATSKLEKAAMKRLLERDVTLEEIAELVYDLQEPYLDNLTMELCLDNVKAVLRKREVQNAVLTGIELDVLTEEGKLASPLQEIIKNDEGLYGIDEVLALAIVNVYGSIGFTNFGYLDKVKPKVIERLDSLKGEDEVNTFLDDIVGAIAAAAASRIAHAEPEAEEGVD